MCFRSTTYNSCSHVQSATKQSCRTGCKEIIEELSTTVEEECMMCASGFYAKPAAKEVAAFQEFQVGT